ncbi:MAG: carboxypeptidase-like regulatory domain-containing protein [Candidatus Pacebacteria bacterium]|nr:carboxypeptidase-like regulatory domain-containing protein [Candidatus Paceibacterota bacterium]
MKTGRTVLLAATAFAALAVVSIGSRDALIAPESAQAQNLGVRVVSGAVLTEDSEPVIGATVFLKNEKTKAIRSYTSTEKGHFYFAQVNMAQDFDLWAEKGGKKSAVKTVSSWDSRKTFVSDLKLK